MSDRIESYGVGSRKALKPFFESTDVDYPPQEMIWVGLKAEKLLLLFANDKSGKPRLVKSYPVFGASGETGPKLKEGDLQVPEGFYRITELKPDSIAHLALRLNYPNSFDLKNAAREGRTDPGCDIMIHGSYWSTGCLAMGDDAIEELFVLAYDTGKDKIKVILAPCDLTSRSPQVDLKEQPDWLPGLYKRLTRELKKLPMPAANPFPFI